MKVAEAFVEISARFDRLASGLNSAVAKTREATGRMQRAFRGLDATVQRVTASISSLVTGIAGRLAAAFSVVAVVGYTKRLTELIDTQSKFAARIGTDINTLRSLEFAGQRAGVGVNQLRMGLQRLTRRSAEAAMGTGEAVAAFAELGINAVEFNRLAPDAKLQTLAAAFQNVASDADKTRLAFKLFDAEGVGIKVLLDEGPRGIEQLQREFRKLGGEIEDNGRGAVALANAWTNAKTALEGFAAANLTPILNALTNVLQAITDITKEFGGLTNLVNAVTTAIAQQILQSVGFVVKQLGAIIDGIGSTLSVTGFPGSDELRRLGGNLVARGGRFQDYADTVPVVFPVVPDDPRKNRTIVPQFGANLAGAAGQAAVAATRAATQSISTAIGGFTTGTDRQIQQNMLQQQQQQTRLLTTLIAVARGAATSFI